MASPGGAANIVFGIVAGLKLAVFFTLLIYVYLTQRADDAKWFPFYIVAGALGVIAVIEFFHVMAMAEGELMMLNIFADFAAVELAMELLFLIAGIALVVFHYLFFSHIDAEEA